MFNLKNTRKAVALIAVAAALAGAAVGANAQTSDAAAPAQSATSNHFAAHKQNALARIAKRIEVLQSLQSCVQAANDHAALKACHLQARSAMKNG